MQFNEQNSVENFIIRQLSGVNLNPNQAADAHAPYGKVRWQYCAPEEVPRDTSEVWAEPWLQHALERLNPEIAQKPERGQEVIHQLRNILISANEVGLVRANQVFREWLTGEHTMPFGENNRHVTVKLIDFDNLSNNQYIITRQYHLRQRNTRIPDIVLLINGLPVVIGEAKTPVRPAVSWVDGASQVKKYEDEVTQLFVPNILSFATEGKSLHYGAVRTPLRFWAPWRVPGSDITGLAGVGNELADLLKPACLLDILQNFSLYTSNQKKSKRLKIICRYQQYEGTNKIVERVKEGKIKKGLIWHFQGSGKSLLMLFAAQKLRKAPGLKSPTVIVLVDRTDLDAQIAGTFSGADVANVVPTASIKELRTLLERDTRKIIISMIHKFRDAPANMNTRENIIVLVDEAHRTQEGDLGRQMRAALPNASLFGLTGTPVNKTDKNTFWAFGAKEDALGYMSRYTFHDSIRDKATLPLHFEPRLVDVHLDATRIDELFEVFKATQALSDEEADKLNKSSAKMTEFLKAPERVGRIAQDIALHYKEKVAPQGFKAMVVASDRDACVQYKKALDAHFPPATSQVVISASAKKDTPAFKKQWTVDKTQQEKIVDEFNDETSALKILIVTAKLLTGFDAPVLQTLYLDKSLRDHTLLQAICRTNRLYPDKSFGRVVDYFGVFDDIAKALKFDEKSVQQVISNLSALRDEFAPAITDALTFFAGVDRTLSGDAGLLAAQAALATTEQRDNFAASYRLVARLWEALSPDEVLDAHHDDYVWLTRVYNSLRQQPDQRGRQLYQDLGKQTAQLMHDHIHVGSVHHLETYVLDADVIEEIFNSGDSKKAQTLETMLVKRFEQHAGNPQFMLLSERLRELRNRAELGLITSIQFVKDLCKLAKETLQAERETAVKTPTQALTELFLSIKTGKTPAVVEKIVRKIDGVVTEATFKGWQDSKAGTREVKSALRKSLIEFKLHMNDDLVGRAYAYIEEYY